MPITQFEGKALVFNNGVVDVQQDGVSVVDENKVAHITPGEMAIDNLTIIKNADHELEVPFDNDTIYRDPNSGFIKATGGASEGYVNHEVRTAITYAEQLRLDMDSEFAEVRSEMSDLDFVSEGRLQEAIGDIEFPQADWTATSSSEGFIKNKPSISIGNSATSIQEGDQTTAYGTGSHAEGRQTNATANYAHAEGLYTNAQAQSSHAEGDHTNATVANQHVQGKYNATNANAVDIVGWGVDGARKNISTLHTTGDLHLAGDVYVHADSEGNGGTLLGSGGGSGGGLNSEGVRNLIKGDFGLAAPQTARYISTETYQNINWFDRAMPSIWIVDDIFDSVYSGSTLVWQSGSSDSLCLRRLGDGPGGVGYRMLLTQYAEDMSSAPWRADMNFNWEEGNPSGPISFSPQDFNSASGLSGLVINATVTGMLGDIFYDHRFQRPLVAEAAYSPILIKNDNFKAWNSITINPSSQRISYGDKQSVLSAIYAFAQGHSPDTMPGFPIYVKWVDPANKYHCNPLVIWGSVSSDIATVSLQDQFNPTFLLEGTIEENHGQLELTVTTWPSLS